jgi:hypothetical protein
MLTLKARLQRAFLLQSPGGVRRHPTECLGGHGELVMRPGPGAVVLCRRQRGAPFPLAKNPKHSHVCGQPRRSAGVICARWRPVFSTWKQQRTAGYASKVSRHSHLVQVAALITVSPLGWRFGPLAVPLRPVGSSPLRRRALPVPPASPAPRARPSAVSRSLSDLGRQKRT